jgi:L-ribulose-5-phosphate 4-epimerase
MLEQLKADVLRANLDLVRHGLVVMTWGNASAINAARDLVVVKPSGVPYDQMTEKDMVVVDLDGHVVEGSLKPSSDLPTHLALYLAWQDVGGIVHTHSMHATMFAQACRPIPCYGTTHADHFHGEVPCTRVLTVRETTGDYEANTGEVIVECFADLAPSHMPAVVVANHGPFTWGRDVAGAVHNAVALEQVAQMAIGTKIVNPQAGPIPRHILDKHFLRKHGPGAYYGQAGQS